MNSAVINRARPVAAKSPRWLTALLAFTLAGCREPSTPPAAKPPDVAVGSPVVRDEAEYLVFTGRTDAIESVDVKARVSGYLNEVAFTDGQLVNTGDLLFQIDPRPYQATLGQAEASVEEAKAALTKAEADLERARPLLATRAISAQEFDQIVAARAVSAAALESANAAVAAAKLDLEFTEIRASIAGRISNTRVTKGNLISENEGATLTTIAKTDPMYVYFDVDERSLLDVRAERTREGQQIQAGDIADEKIPIEVGLVTDNGFSHKGIIDFVDNRVDPATGTIRVRGVLSDPENPFLPGLFVRVRVQVGAERPRLLVAERALGIDQGQRFVYLVDEDDKVQHKAVDAGESRDGLRVITSDLPSNARIVVEGLHRVRPGARVTPVEVKMTDFLVDRASAAPPVNATDAVGGKTSEPAEGAAPK
jgi:membrane fusion protein, multidrug efflux system